MILRRPTLDDLDHLCSLESDPLVASQTSYRIAQTRAETLARLESHLARAPSLEPLGVWLAFDGETFAGWCMLLPLPDGSLELGYMVPRAQWRRGYATAMARELIARAGGRSLRATTTPDNENSIRVLTSAGFREIESIGGARKFIR